MDEHSGCTPMCAIANKQTGKRVETTPQRVCKMQNCHTTTKVNISSNWQYPPSSEHLAISTKTPNDFFPQLTQARQLQTCNLNSAALSAQLTFDPYAKRVDTNDFNARDDLSNNRGARRRMLWETTHEQHEMQRTSSAELESERRPTPYADWL